MTNAPEGLPTHRSAFISIIAWLGIISGCFAILAVGGLFLTAPSLRAATMFVGSAVGLAVALGLRSRRNWARLSFIGVQAYAILSTLVGVVRQPQLMIRQPPPNGMSAAEAQAMVTSLRTPALIAGSVFALIAGLIILKLCSRDIRAEFDAL